MDQMAVEWLADAFEFVPTAQLFSLMTVRWQFHHAARMALRRRPYLIICGPEVLPLRGSPDPNFYTLKYGEQCALRPDNLLIMSNLTRLEIDDYFVTRPFDDLVIR